MVHSLQMLHEAAHYYKARDVNQMSGQRDYAALGEELSKKFPNTKNHGTHGWSAFTRVLSGRIRTYRLAEFAFYTLVVHLMYFCCCMHLSCLCAGSSKRRNNCPLRRCAWNRPTCPQHSSFLQTDLTPRHPLNQESPRMVQETLWTQGAGRRTRRTLKSAQVKRPSHPSGETAYT